MLYYGQEWIDELARRKALGKPWTPALETHKQPCPERDAKRESDGNKRVAFIKALIAAGRLNEWLARGAGRVRYVEMCAELGIEPAGIDE